MTAPRIVKLAELSDVERRIILALMAQTKSEPTAAGRKPAMGSQKEGHANDPALL
jgi:hypothetical protein